ncbi:ABC transporter permease [Dickeya dianthicola]|uniref:ABC transporter permease n=1 Tax=Dickeya dianthicola TaxID=204039 RepID=UPI0003F7E0CA|nr:ABC transporter permease [Dickeya dianthicola]MZG41686.1 ABC transporter permease [Dickeya dianthicola]MZH98197.1 ABC transporter permease [Dickeya dianthicola]
MKESVSSRAAAAVDELAPRRRVRLSPEARLFLRNPSGMAGVALLALVAVMALAAPWVYPGDPLDMVAQPFLWPGQDSAFPLGTDSLGRDVAAGVAHGAQVSLQIGFFAVAVSLLIGMTVGASAGFFGGKVDHLLVHTTELFQTFPTFLLVVVLVAIGQPSATLIACAIGVASWPTIARLVRAEFRTWRESDFVLAARSQGFSSLRIMAQEILPNALPSIIVTTSVMVASSILIESALSFLGFGDPNRVSWGSMIGAGRESLRSAWFLTAIPGGALVLTVLALNLVGDALNDALNPRSRRERV